LGNGTDAVEAEGAALGIGAAGCSYSGGGRFGRPGREPHERLAAATTPKMGRAAERIAFMPVSSVRPRVIACFFASCA
jgi:hypothetical protein